MADLNLVPEERSNPWRAILIAVGVVIVLAVAVFALNPHETGKLTVLRVQTFSPHTEFKAMSNAAGSRVMGSGAEDNLYVIATVQLKDELRLPLFVSSAGATMLLEDGTEATATVISAREIPNLEKSFPAMTGMLPHPLLDGAEAAPGGTAEGEVPLLFAGMTQKTWDTKKSATLTLNLAHQDPLSVALK